ncbi:MAG: hypothetical protein M3P26_15595 [Gemmatimonadota bacterium]|nr:hypothetical protein [Gemmatimonadota bacterium]
MTSTALTGSRNTPLAIALLTGGYLFGGFFVGMAFSLVVGSPNPGAFHMTRNVLAGVIAVACMIAASTAWARDLARRMGTADLRHAGWAGALSFGPVALAVGLTLTWLEQRIVERGAGPAPPIHIVYGMLFIPASFVVASVSAWILGVGLRLSASEQRRLTLATGLAAAGAYLVVYLVMELAGWQVGAPGAAQRATMLVVTALGCLAAALAGGAALGTVLFRPRTEASR